ALDAEACKLISIVQVLQVFFADQLARFGVQRWLSCIGTSCWHLRCTDRDPRSASVLPGVSDVRQRLLEFLDRSLELGVVVLVERSQLSIEQTHTHHRTLERLRRR